MCIDCVVPSWQGDHLGSIAGHPIGSRIRSRLHFNGHEGSPRLLQNVYGINTPAGTEVVLDLKDEDYGGRGFTCRDLEGNVWNFGTMSVGLGGTRP